MGLPWFFNPMFFAKVHHEALASRGPNKARRWVRASRCFEPPRLAAPNMAAMRVPHIQESFSTILARVRLDAKEAKFMSVD